MHQAINQEIVASAHGVYRGGLGIHLAMVSMAGYSDYSSGNPLWLPCKDRLGMTIDLSLVPAEQVKRNDLILFSESPGRFIVTIDPKNKERFEKIFKGLPFACVGKVTDKPDFIINGIDGNMILNLSVDEMKKAWKKPFGGLL